MSETDIGTDKDTDVDRRAFLKAAGRCAVVLPPAMTFLLSTTMSSEATMSSSKGDGKKPHKHKKFFKHKKKWGWWGWGRH
jgi:hypothetical protein